MKPLLKKRVRKMVEGKEFNIGFTPLGNKHLYSDTFGRAKSLKPEELKGLDSALEKSVYVRSAPITKKRKDNITKFYYFKDLDKKRYYNVAEEKVSQANGAVKTRRFLYSVTNKIR